MRVSYEYGNPYKTLAGYAVALIALLGASRGCSEIIAESENEIIEYIEDSGYLNPQIRDIDKLPNPATFIGCDEEKHSVKYEFSAQSTISGRIVDGIVCDGPFVGKSIRD